MHGTERHRIIISAVQERPVASVVDLVSLTGASEATIRRDIATLHMQKCLRRVRGGAESMTPPQSVGLAGRPFSVNEGIKSVRLPGLRWIRARTATRSSSMAARHHH